MKYNKRIVKRTLVDADIEISRILAEQIKLLSWLKQNHPDVRKEYDDFRLAEAIGFETKKIKWQAVVKWSEETGYEEIAAVRNSEEEAKKDLEGLDVSIKAGASLPYIGAYINNP